MVKATDLKSVSFLERRFEINRNPTVCEESIRMLAIEMSRVTFIFSL